MDENIWNIFEDFKEIVDKSDDEIDENLKNEIKNKMENISINTDCCIECGKENLYNSGEFMICLNCGVQNDMLINHNQEWRNYSNNEQDQSRCGLPVNQLLQNGSLTTTILGKGNENFRKLNTWNGISYRERSLINVLNQISHVAKSGNIPSCIVDKTIVMYKILSEDNIKRGESRESLIAACLLYALYDRNIIRSNNEISNLFGIKNKKLTKGCNEFAKIMYKKNNDYLKNIKSIEPVDLIDRYCDILNIQEKYKKYAIYVAKTTDYLGICSENNPKSIAVGSIYLIVKANGLKITKKDISDKCITSDVTITKIYNSMIKYQKYLLSYDESKI